MYTRTVLYTYAIYDVSNYCSILIAGQFWIALVMHCTLSDSSMLTAMHIVHYITTFYFLFSGMVVLLSLMLLTINAVKLQELNVNVQYLHSNRHLSDSSVAKHIFFCGVKGMTLQWEVNNAPLGGFTEGQVGTVLRNSKSNFNYSAVLLSSQRDLEYYSFSSLLIISSARSHLLEVVCVSDVGYNVTNNNNVPLLLQQEMQQNRSDASGNVILQDLFSSGDMLNNTESIDMFICGVQEDFQSWEVNENGLPFGFSILDNEDRSIPSPALDRTSVTTLAFLTTSEPYRLATYLLLVGHSNVNITSACGRYHVNLFIHDQQQIPTTTAQAYNDLTTSSKEYSKVSKECSFTSEISVASKQ